MLCFYFIVLAYTRVSTKSTGILKKKPPKNPCGTQFFSAGLLKVIQDPGLQYFYSIPTIVLQSKKILDQNWPKAARWFKYDRIRFIPPIVPQNRFGFAVLLLCYSNSTANQIWGRSNFITCRTFIQYFRVFEKLTIKIVKSG